METFHLFDTPDTPELPASVKDFAIALPGGATCPFCHAQPISHPIKCTGGKPENLGYYFQMCPDRYSRNHTQGKCKFFQWVFHPENPSNVNVSVPPAPGAPFYSTSPFSTPSHRGKRATCEGPCFNGIRNQTCTFFMCKTCCINRQSSTPGTRCTVSAHAISADTSNNKHNAPLHAPAQSPQHAPPQNDPPQTSSSQASQNLTPRSYGRMVDPLYQEKLASFPEMFTLSPVGDSPSKAQLRNLENQKVRVLWWFSDDECPELFKADCATHPYFQPALDLAPALRKAFPEDPQFTECETFRAYDPSTGEWPITRGSVTVDKTTNTVLLRHVRVKQCLDFEKYDTSPTARRLRDTNNKRPSSAAEPYPQKLRVLNATGDPAPVRLFAHVHQQPAFQDILDLTLCDSELDTTPKNATDISGQGTAPALPSTQNHGIQAAFNRHSINAPQSQPNTTHASLIHGPSKSGFPLKYACDMDHCFKRMGDMPGNSKTKIKFESVYGGIPYVSSTYSDHCKIWKKVKDTPEFASAVAAGHSTEGLWSTVFRSHKNTK